MTYRSKFIFLPNLSPPGEGGMGVFLERPDCGLSIWSSLKMKFSISVLVVIAVMVLMFRILVGRSLLVTGGDEGGLGRGGCNWAGERC